jgi:hypothetical protein
MEVSMRQRSNHIIFVSIFILVIISGCVNAPSSKVTPAVTAPSVVATVAAPAIIVTSYPASVDTETDLGIDWEVSGGMPGNISRTAIIWGFNMSSANVSDYPEMSTVKTGKTPQQFNTILDVPLNNGTIYFRAYAVVDGIDIYSDEYQTIIVPPAVSGEY